MQTKYYLITTGQMDHITKGLSIKLMLSTSKPFAQCIVYCMLSLKLSCYLFQMETLPSQKAQTPIVVL